MLFDVERYKSSILLFSISVLLKHQIKCNSINNGLVNNYVLYHQWLCKRHSSILSRSIEWIWNRKYRGTQSPFPEERPLNLGEPPCHYFPATVSSLTSNSSSAWGWRPVEMCCTSPTRCSQHCLQRLCTIDRSGIGKYKRLNLIRLLLSDHRTTPIPKQYLTNRAKKEKLRELQLVIVVHVCAYIYCY